jgi:glucose-6-phosphate 1-dehydrogenase
MASPPACDALVLFGVTGDLVSKMVLPALARLAERGVAPPVVGVAHSPGEPAAIVGASRERVGRSDAALAAQMDRLVPRLSIVAGDLDHAETYARLASALKDVRQPLFYLAIPPELFCATINGLAAVGLARTGRLAVEKPFGHDLESARALERTIAAAFHDDAVYRIDHFLGKDPLRNLADMRARTAWLEPLWSHAHVTSVQVTMAEAFGIGARGAFYEAVGVLRDVFQNHLLEVCALIAMEPVAPADGEAFAAARVDALRAIAPLVPADVVYGQYAGYRSEPGVAADSQIATYVAARLSIDAPRFAGVPFYVRAGKRLPLTTTMVTLSLTPMRVLHEPCVEDACEALCFRLGPGAVTIELRTRRLAPGSARDHAPLTLHAALPPDEDRDAYVNLLGAALTGDRSMSDRATGVTAAWRVVEGILRAPLAVHPYADGSWGPTEADRLLRPGERWIDPELP